MLSFHRIAIIIVIIFFLTTNRWVILDRNEQPFILCCFHDPRSLLNTLQLHNCKSTIGNAIKLNILQRFLIKMHVWREVIVWPVGFPQNHHWRKNISSSCKMYANKTACKYTFMQWLKYARNILGARLKIARMCDCATEKYIHGSHRSIV